MTAEKRSVARGPLLTLPKLAERSGVGIKTLRRAVRSGDLPAYKVAEKWQRVFWSEFVDWLRAHRVEAQKSRRTPSS